MARGANPNSCHSTLASKHGESAPCVSTPTSAKVTLAKVHFPKSEQVNGHSRPPLSLPQPVGWMALPRAAGARPALQTQPWSAARAHTSILHSLRREEWQKDWEQFNIKVWVGSSLHHYLPLF